MVKERYVFDLSVCREYAGRPASGIIRVEREIGSFFLDKKDTVFVAYDAPNRCFRTINLASARNFIGGAPIPQEIGKERRLQYGARFFFEDRDIYINCGLPWDTDLLSYIFSEKQKNDIFVVQMVYDLIPSLMAELCVPGMRHRFPKFVLDAAWTADALFSISDSTQQDIETQIARMDLPVPALRRIKLGASQIAKSAGEFPSEISMLESQEFVIFVSSIEPRKNHILLFNIWQSLYSELGSELPMLVFIGSQGWNSNDLLFFIHNSDLRLQNKILILNHLSDIALSFIYDNCLFSLYPSLYEGWGLPISESIAHGKFCIASNSSSMPEAGQGLLDLIDPRNFQAWLDRCRHYILDREELRERTEALLRLRSIRSWEECARDFFVGIKDVVDEKRRG